jgi:hypothetical protein
VLKGTKDQLDVTINIVRESPTTAKVEVTARETLAEWDKDYVKEVLNRIVETPVFGFPVLVEDDRLSLRPRRGGERSCCCSARVGATDPVATY